MNCPPWSRLIDPRCNKGLKSTNGWFYELSHIDSFEVLWSRVSPWGKRLPYESSEVSQDSFEKHISTSRLFDRRNWDRGREISRSLIFADNGRWRGLSIFYLEVNCFSGDLRTCCNPSVSVAAPAVDIAWSDLRLGLHFLYNDRL